MSASNTKELRRICSEIDNVDPGGPEREIEIWRLIAAANSERSMRAALEYAQDSEQIKDTISEWGEFGESEFQQQGNVKSIWWRNPISQDAMIVIPSGRFLFGRQEVCEDLFGFSLARYPTTNRQFQRFLDETGYKPKDDQAHGSFLAHWQDEACSIDLLDHPVTWVNLDDATAYCEWAGGYLPLEKQWEKAARGPDGREFPWGNAYWSRTARIQVGNFGSDSTVPVGSFDGVRSPYGCLELSGNVSQWVIQDSSTSSDHGMVRGGCFYRRKSSASTRSAHVRMLHRLRRNQWVGFRLCA